MISFFHFIGLINFFAKKTCLPEARVGQLITKGLSSGNYSKSLPGKRLLRDGKMTNLANYQLLALYSCNLLRFTKIYYFNERQWAQPGYTYLY